MSYSKFGPFTDVPQAQWANPPAGAVALSSAALNHLEDGLVAASAAADANTTAVAGKVAKGALTLNVRDYGAAGNGTTDDTAAINAALAACPEGGDVLLPAGRYLISSPITLKRNRTLRGTHAARWPYDTGSPCCLVAAASFTGTAMIYLPDEEELTGSVSAPADFSMMAGPGDQSGIRILRLALDGQYNGTTLDGVRASGLVRDLRMMEVSIRRMTGVGIHTVAYVRKDGKSYYPRGWACHQVVTDRTQGNGWSTSYLDDSTLVDCIAGATQTANGIGFQFLGPGELLLIGCRALWNGSHGFYFTGQNYGNVVLSGCSTDRNFGHGITTDMSGTGALLLAGVVLRRDGRNGNASLSTYAGLRGSGATCPIIVSGLTTMTGVDDDATGLRTPAYGASFTNCAAVSVAGALLVGVTAGLLDGGGNTILRQGTTNISGSGNSATPTYA